MVEKKPTKKVIKKPEEKEEKKVVIEEIKAPVIDIVKEPSEDDMEDDDISMEIAKSIKETAGKPDRYFEAIGRRKTAVARVRLFTKGDKEFIVNDQPF